MNDNTLTHLESLGLTLPAVPKPVAAYENFIITGNLLYLSGGLPIDGETKYIGKVPSACSIEDAIKASEMIILNRLAVAKEALGSLDKIAQVVTLNGFVNSETDFYNHPQIINGASELLVKILGERGRHSRTALGAAALPLNVSVEINLILEIAE